MPRLRTLNELSHLQDSGFGQPSPRHGLKLLYWFVNKYIEFDDNNEMCWRFDPEKRFYGFHPFENRYNGYDQLLPDTGLPYYEVGNLSKPRAKRLPKYVRRDYTGYHDNSNTDRIIVSVDDEYFDRVYVTEHRGDSDYNPNGTFRISRGLIMIIQDYTLDSFLGEIGSPPSRTSPTREGVGKHVLRLTHMKPPTTSFRAAMLQPAYPPNLLYVTDTWVELALGEDERKLVDCCIR